MHGGIALIRHQRLRRPVERIVRAAYRGGTGYTLRTLALAVVSGVVAGFVAQALDVPAPSVLGLWVGLWSLIPVLGLVIGYLPVIGLAAAEDRTQGCRSPSAILVRLAGAGRAGPAALDRPAQRRRQPAAPDAVGHDRPPRRADHRGHGRGVPGRRHRRGAGRGPAAERDGRAEPRARRAPDACRSATVAADPTAAAAMTDLPAAPASAGTDDRPARHLVIDVAPRSVVFALVVVVTLVLSYRMLTDIPAVLIRTALGVFLALALDPVVDAAMRRLSVRRAVAVTLVVGGFLAGAGTFGVLAVPRAVNQLSQVGEQVPDVISDLDNLPLVGTGHRRERHRRPGARLPRQPARHPGHPGQGAGRHRAVHR